MLALSYDLTLSSIKGVVLKATNLKKQDVIGLAGECVCVSDCVQVSETGITVMYQVAITVVLVQTLKSKDFVCGI